MVHSEKYKEENESGLTSKAKKQNEFASANSVYIIDYDTVNKTNALPTSSNSSKSNNKATSASTNAEEKTIVPSNWFYTRKAINQTRKVYHSARFAIFAYDQKE